MFGEEKEKEDDTLDPEEPVLADKRGVNAEPWHPAEMGAPYIYKVCLIGPCGAGKSAIANRLVAHSFDPTYRATRQPAQLFWRHTEPHTGHDIMVEIEDTPGVSGETVESGELSDRGLYEAEQLLRPLVWFEKRRKEKDGKKASKSTESDPLIPPKAGDSKKGKDKGAGSYFSGISSAASSAAASIGDTFGVAAETQRMNPIGEDRKRMGFLIVADVSDAASFTAAYAIADRIFDRVQFDIGDQARRSTCTRRRIRVSAECTPSHRPPRVRTHKHTVAQSLSLSLTLCLSYSTHTRRCAPARSHAPCRSSSSATRATYAARGGRCPPSLCCAPRSRADITTGKPTRRTTSSTSSAAR